MKTSKFNLFTLGLLAIALIVILSSLNPKTELEIYTDRNIYYINGLEVTDEANDEILYFNSMEALKKWLSDKTAEDVESSY